MVASFGIWGYAYSGQANRPLPDRLDESAFRNNAEIICQQALEEIELVPGAAKASDPADRRAQIFETTARFEQMLVELEDIVSGSDRDRQIINDWLDDWRVVIDDRYRFADAIIEDPDNARYLQTDTGVGERLDKRLTRLSLANNMPACGSPTDVG